MFQIVSITERLVHLDLKRHVAEASLPEMLLQGILSLLHLAKRTPVINLCLKGHTCLGLTAWNASSRSYCRPYIRHSLTEDPFFSSHSSFPSLRCGWLFGFCILVHQETDRNRCHSIRVHKIITDNARLLDHLNWSAQPH